MLCEFQQVDDVWVCSICNHRTRVRVGKPAPTRSCGPEIPADLAAEFDGDLAEVGVVVNGDDHRKSLWAQWREAVTRWKAAGKPMRDKQTVETYLSICRQCEEIGSRLGIPYCQVCGCNLKTPAIGSLSKIRMATEVCPKEKWQ